MVYIQGESRQQIVMFPEIMDDYIDENNPVRVIDAYIDRLNLCELEFQKPEPNETGRPMYSPKDMLKLYLYGYTNKIRSSRRLEIESKRNLELIWLMKKLSPDHKTIARFRRDNKKALKNVFRNFVRLCDRLGLFGKELVSIDGSKFKAVNSNKRNFSKERLEYKLKKIEEKIEEYISNLDKSDKEEETYEGQFNPLQMKEIIKSLEEKKERCKDILSVLQSTGEQQKSLTDSDSRKMLMADGKYDVCYNVQTAVDSKNGLIAEFKVTNQLNDRGQLYDMAVSSKQIFEVESIIATADKGYEGATEISKCINSNILPQVAMIKDSIHICVESGEEHEKPESHINGRCVYLEDRNIGLCPMGEILRPSTYNKSKGKMIFTNRKACKNCNCKCTSEAFRRFDMPAKKEDFKKTYNDLDLKFKQIEIKPDKEMLKKRRCLSEHPFGILKRVMDHEYCLTKGLDNVSGEFSLAILAFNLKRALKILGANKIIDELCKG